MDWQMAPIRVMGLGDPVMDLLAHVTHDLLATITSEPGGCFSVDPSDMTTLLAKVQKESEIKR